MFDDDVAAAFLARVAAGERIRDLLARPGMPSQGAYRYWSRTQVGFQAELWRLRGVRYSGHSGEGHSRYRAWDARLAARIVSAVRSGAVLRRLLTARAELPCLTIVERWRREHPAWDRELRAAMAEGRLARGRRVGMRGGGACTAALANEILDRVTAGASLRGLAGKSGMPCGGTLYAWMRKRPAFAHEVRQAQMIGRLSRQGRVLNRVVDGAGADEGVERSPSDGRLPADDEATSMEGLGPGRKGPRRIGAVEAGGATRANADPAPPVVHPAVQGDAGEERHGDQHGGGEELVAVHLPALVPRAVTPLDLIVAGRQRSPCGGASWRDHSSAC
jgi:hypothetical protein